MIPLLKVTAALVLFVGLIGLGWLLARQGTGPSGHAEVRLSTPPPVQGTHAGDALPPEHERLRDQYERQRYEAAAEGPGAQAFVKDIRALQPNEKGTLARNPHWPGASTVTEKPPPAGPDSHRVGQKRAYLSALSGTWDQPSGHHTVTVAKAAPAPVAAAASTTVTATLPLTGAIHVATLLVGVNSDVPAPVVATLLKPPLQGATLTGRFTRADDGVLIQFTRLTYQGQTYAVEAFAVDLDSGTALAATHVDRRSVSRWAAVLASAVLGGLQRGVLADSRVTTPGLGTVVVERDISGRDLAAIAVGEIGRRTRPMAERYFDRPNTVTLKEAVGVVFMDNGVAVIDPRAGAAPAPAAPADAVRQALERNLPALANPTPLANPPPPEEDDDGPAP